MTHERDQRNEPSNVISLAGARKQTKDAKRTSRSPLGGERRPTVGQWLMSAFLVVLAIGGVFALAVPLLRAAGIVGG